MSQIVPADAYYFFKKLEQDNLSFMFCGNFSDDLTEKILRLSEQNIDRTTELTKLKKRVSFLMAECFQNILRHTDDKHIEKSTKPKTFITRNIKDAYYIASANLIENEKVAELENKIKDINSLSPEELKALHLQTLSGSEISEKGGAGLGLIEMARKSGQKLNFTFKPLQNKKESIFFLQLCMQSTLKQEETEAIFSEFKELYEEVCEPGIIMIYKGDFTTESINPVIEMVENNLEGAENTEIKKKTFSLLVKLLENINKHAREYRGMHEGIFLLQSDKQHYTLTTGNYIETSRAKALKEYLNRLNGMTKEELEKLYQQKSTEVNKEESMGLGLLEAARHSNSKFQFSLNNDSEKHSFFSFSITI